MAEFLFVAHPGHELLVFDRFRTADLRVMVLTDGSGGAGQPRTGLSRALVSRLGGKVVEPFGLHADARFYEAILARDVGFFGEIVDRLADALDDPAIDTLITDAVEHYNPVHDLCFVIGALAARRLERRGRRLRRLVCPIAAEGEGVSRLEQALDALATADKRHAARDFEDLIGDLSSLIEARPQLVEQEILIAPCTDGPLLPTPLAPPYYETYGRRRLAARGGGELITYVDHVAPLVLALEARESVRQPEARPRAELVG